MIGKKKGRGLCVCERVEKEKENRKYSKLTMRNN